MSTALVLERLSSNGKPPKLDFRTDSIEPKVGRRCCSSCRDPADEDVVAVLARRKDCARRKAVELLGSSPAAKTLDTDIIKKVVEIEVQAT